MIIHRTYNGTRYGTWYGTSVPGTIIGTVRSTYFLEVNIAVRGLSGYCISD
jgi:hypothetical protein